MQLGLGLLFLAACYLLLYDRRILAGALIAIAGMTKPQFLPLGLLAAWRERLALRGWATGYNHNLRDDVNLALWMV